MQIKKPYTRRFSGLMEAKTREKIYEGDLVELVGLEYLGTKRVVFHENKFVPYNLDGLVKVDE